MPGIQLRSAALALARMNPFAIADPLRQPWRKLWYTAALPFSILQLRPKLLCSTGLLRRILSPTVLCTSLLPSRILLRGILSPLLSPLVRVLLARLEPTRRDRSNIAVARFLDMPRRIAQERVPTAFNVGSRDVTWTSRPTPLIPFRVFSRVSRAPFLRQSGVVTEIQFLIGLRVLCGLLCVCSSSTGYRWATVFGRCAFWGQTRNSEEESFSQKIAKITKTIPSISGRRLVPTLHIRNGRRTAAPNFLKGYRKIHRLGFACSRRT